MNKCKCYTQMLEEEFEKTPTYRDCDCGHAACLACNFYRSKGAVVHFAPERASSCFTGQKMLGRWKFNELYDYAVHLEKELASLRSDEVDLFAVGNVLKSDLRTERSPLFVMVCYDYEESNRSFRAVALLDRANEHEIGVAYNNWNKFQSSEPDVPSWICSSFKEVANAK